MGLLGVLGLVTVTALEAGFDTQTAVVDSARRNAGLRDACEHLARELRYAVQDSIAITPQPDGNDRLEFQEVVPGGAGVVDPALDPPAQLDWRHRFEVVASPGGPALVRSTVDDQGQVRSTETALDGLAPEAGAAFRVEPVGDLLRITVRVDKNPGENDAEQVLEIAARN
jgi:hypothetical protein